MPAMTTPAIIFALCFVNIQILRRLSKQKTKKQKKYMNTTSCGRSVGSVMIIA